MNLFHGPLLQRNRRAFTLVELMLSLSITAMVGLIVVGMVTAAIQSTEIGRTTRRSTVKRQVADLRLAALIRSASRVLDIGTGFAVLWTGDGNGDLQPNLSELLRISWSAPAQSLEVYAAPASLDPSSDTAFDISEDFGAVTAALAGTANFSLMTRLDSVIACSFDIGAVPPTSARSIRVDMTVQHDSNDKRIRVITSCRSEIES